MSKNRYLHGDCFVYALALHELHGWDVAIICDEAEGIAHAVAVNNEGALVDASGITTLDDIITRYDLLSAEAQPISQDGLWLLSGCTHQQVKRAKQFIHRQAMKGGEQLPGDA